MKNELKSCPFCGGDAQLSHFKLFARCPKCRSGSSDWLPISIWNSRHTDEPKTKIAEGLKAFAWTKQGNTSLLDLVDDEIILHQPTEKIERNSIDCVLDALLAICDETTK